tara:strand:+ start:1740 stop:2153 length:414 start_codon:yes stop_codon:yes gene_type:complete
MWKKSRLESGEETGRKLLGDKWDLLIEALSSKNQDITKYIVEWGYGEIYNRPQLNFKAREIVALTSLAMQGLKPQLKTHIISSLNAGLKEEEIIEVFIHLALFAGFPTALFAIEAARDVFDSGSGKSPPVEDEKSTQ